MNNRFLLKQFAKWFDFECLNNYLLIYEDSDLFYNTLCDLNEKDFSSFIELFSENKKDDISNYVTFIDSIIYLDLNVKKNINIIRNQIKKDNLHELSYLANQVTDMCNNLFDNIKLDYQVEIESKGMVTEDDILDLLDIKINLNGKSFIEKILRFIKATVELYNTKIFIFTGLTHYLDENDLNLLLQESKYLESIIIDIERKDIQISSFDEKLIFDKDFCII